MDDPATIVKDKYKHLKKHELEIRQCIRCGDCREAIDLTDNPPRSGVCAVREHTSGFEPFFSRGKMQIMRSLLDENLELSKDMAEVIFQCPTCNACSEMCAYNINNAMLYEALRAELVEAGHALNDHDIMNKVMIEKLNPYNRENKEKNDWINELGFKIKDALSEKSEVLYFVGCTAALSPDIQPVAINTAKVLKKLEVDFSILGSDEICCGSVALRTRNLKAFKSVSEKNINLFKDAGIKKIITSCAGCFRTLQKDYGESLKELGITVQHSIQLIKEVIDQKEIELRHLEITTTYHDPCHTGRNSGGNPLFDEPRELLARISNLKEMKSIREHAKCCGAGGGVKKAFPELALDIAKTRIEEVKETNAEFIVSICPFCEKNLYDAVKSAEINIKAIDLLELLEQALL